MRFSLRFPLPVAVMLIVAGITLPVARGQAPGGAAGKRVATDARARDLDIAFYEARARRDSAGARDRMQLAALHLQRARATGSNDDLVRAEVWARASLGLRTGRNGAAAVALASALLAQHRFVEARDVALRLVRADPDRASYRALLGEIDLELGRYAEADSIFTALPATGDALALGPRLARWAELRGRPDDARQYLRAALAAARTRAAMPPEQLAWLHLRLGELALRYGTADAANAELQSGLDIAPDDHRLLGALARVEYARARWGHAIDYGERAMAILFEPATLGLLSDAYAATGDAARALEYRRAMTASVRGQPGSFHRAWSLLLLDHGEAIPLVLERARAELETRRDVYGYDLLAWALYRAGRPAEAMAPMRTALAQGTRDPMLHRHARAIARAVLDSLVEDS